MVGHEVKNLVVEVLSDAGVHLAATEVAQEPEPAGNCSNYVFLIAFLVADCNVGQVGVILLEKLMFKLFADRRWAV